MRRPSAAREALTFSPLMEARRAHSSRTKRVPFQSAGAQQFAIELRDSSTSQGSVRPRWVFSNRNVFRTIPRTGARFHSMRAEMIMKKLSVSLLLIVTRESGEPLKEASFDPSRGRESTQSQLNRREAGNGLPQRHYSELAKLPDVNVAQRRRHRLSR